MGIILLRRIIIVDADDHHDGGGGDEGSGGIIIIIAIGRQRGGSDGGWQCEFHSLEKVAEGKDSERSLSPSINCSAVTSASSSRDGSNRDATAVSSDTEALFANWRQERQMLRHAAPVVVAVSLRY